MNVIAQAYESCPKELRAVIDSEQLNFESIVSAIRAVIENQDALYEMHAQLLCSRVNADGTLKQEEIKHLVGLGQSIALDAASANNSETMYAGLRLAHTLAHSLPVATREELFSEAKKAEFRKALEASGVEQRNYLAELLSAPEQIL